MSNLTEITSKEQVDRRKNYLVKANITLSVPRAIRRNQIHVNAETLVSTSDEGRASIVCRELGLHLASLAGKTVKQGSFRVPVVTVWELPSSSEASSAGRKKAEESTEKVEKVDNAKEEEGSDSEEEKLAEAASELEEPKTKRKTTRKTTKKEE